MLAVVLALAGCGDDGDAGGPPHIDSLSVATGAAGDTIDVMGAHFCGPSMVADMGACDPPVAGIVTFAVAADAGPVGRGQVMAWKDRAITVKVPGGLPAGPCKVKVVVDTVASNEVDFTLK